MSLRVVVNVDDLGLHVAVRRAVESLATLGRVTSASVLANGPDLDGVTNLDGVSLGAHLNILRGRPLSPAREVRTLVGANGLFLGDYRSLWHRVRRRAVSDDEVRLEWSRQIDRLLERGLRLSHADGEKHTHAWPALFPIAAELAERYRLAYLRVPRERWTPFAPLSAQARILLLRWWLRGIDPRVRTTDGIWGIAHRGATLTAQAFERSFADVGAANRSVEIVCHPGLEVSGDGGISDEFGRMSVRARWRAEYDALRDPAWDERIAAHNWRLVGFDSL